VSSLYTFHSYDAGGAPVAMLAAAFPSDAAAIAYVDRLLAEHRSADYVVVCEAEREIATRYRTTVP
jgi:hypothetical protein